MKEAKERSTKNKKEREIVCHINSSKMGKRRGGEKPKTSAR